MKKVVVGASGTIGGALYRLARNSCETIGTSTIGSDDLVRLRLDALDDFDFDVLQNPDVAFIAAGITSPDLCSREHFRAWAVNVTGTSLFISKAISRGARVIFFSSDTVYGERVNEVDETARCNPTGAYAVMKNEVERRFLGNPSFKTIRLSYVFSKKDKFTRYLLECVERGEEAEIFHPFLRAVLHRDDVVQGALALAQRWDEFPQSVINFGGPEVISRVEFAQALRDSVLSVLRFQPVEPEPGFFTNRPRVIQMKSPFVASLLKRPVSSLRDAIQVEFGNEGRGKHG